MSINFIRVFITNCRYVYQQLLNSVKAKCTLAVHVGCTVWRWTDVCLPSTTSEWWITLWASNRRELVTLSITLYASHDTDQTPHYRSTTYLSSTSVPQVTYIMLTNCCDEICHKVFKVTKTGAVLHSGRGQLFSPQTSALPTMYHETLCDEVKASGIRCKKEHSVAFKINSNQIYLRHKAEYQWIDIIIRQMCRQDTKAVPTALTGAFGGKNTNYNSKWRQH